ncbi:hypothetical protein ATANTOWER_006013 [Ataeniobius toweri]|uniref:Uncharacterized protein n=1 Tax=Ataeniobius toweri TaxID=208326 RepID=A0ABU7B5I4_9TELE|nr:hypothetical protein [Ataeniobius toweri]
MNKDSSVLLLRWIKPAGSLLVPSFLGPPSANPVHPPSSTAPTSDTLGPINILALQYSQSPVSRVNNPLVSPHPLWRISPSIHLCPGSSFLHFPEHCK